jgi:hydroxymethylpyrimidine/phosphomethylpyrimidine kinase
VDPVLRASTGAALLDGDGDALSALVALATVVTPNLEEAAGLVGGPVDDRRTMEAAARTLLRRGARAVLVTGGHLGHDQPAADCLVLAGRADAVWLEGPRLAQPHTHGSGCVLSAAITAQLARGADVETACRQAKRFTAGAIAAGLPLGKGTGPVNPAVLGTSAVNPAV